MPCRLCLFSCECKKAIQLSVSYSSESYFYWTQVQSLATLVSDSLTDCCLVDLTDVILAFEDANSKLAEVVTVADVDDEDRLGNSLLQIWELGFGRKVKLLSRL